MPEIRLPAKLSLPPYQTVAFPNGMKIYVINNPNHELCKVEWIFNAGRWYEPLKGVALFTNRLLREGSSKFNSREIAEKLDFIGATLHTTSTVDHASISLTALNKHFQDALIVVEDIIKRPVFDENELEIVIRNKKQRLRVDLQKVEFVADQKMNVLLYGENHPYGYEDEEKNYEAINPSLLRNFHQKHYTPSNGFMLVSGKVTDEILKLLEKFFGDTDWKGSKVDAPDIPFQPASQRIFKQTKKGAFQTAIRFCLTTIGKAHTDYHRLSVLNTILGGYFGSRLMTNIREDKGYTYGIYSGITHSVRSSYLYIATEVGKTVSNEAVKEIIFEIERLKKETVSEEELQVARNYLIGKLVGNFDTPFHVASVYKNLFIHGLDIEYLHAYMDTIRSVSPEALHDMANRYFDIDKMYQILIG
jgi:predicted Zn-dependent peptidase